MDRQEEKLRFGFSMKLLNSTTFTTQVAAYSGRRGRELSRKPLTSEQ